MMKNIKTVRPKFAKKNRDTILPSKLARFINDCVAILLFALTAMVALALATHSPNDSCWSKSVNSPIVVNKLGVAGAYLSDILFYVLGFSAWWLVAGVFYLGFHKIVRKKIPTGNWSTIYRVISYIFLISASATFEYISFFHQASSLPDGWGGSLGSFIFNNSYRGVGEVGVSVLSLLFIIICFSFSFGISWLFIAEKIGAVLEMIYVQLTSLVARKSPVAENGAAVIDDEEDEFIAPKATEQYFEPEPLVVPRKDIDIEEPVVKKLSFSERLFKSRTEGASTENTNINDEPDFDINDPLFQDDESDEVVDAPLTEIKPIVHEPIVNSEPPRVAGLKIALKSNNVRTIDLLDAVQKGSLPSTSLLNLPRVQAEGVPPETIEYVSTAIENTLAEFGIEVKITNVESGPVVTRYELIPPKGVRGDKIAGLAKEIARSLALTSIRIVETIPGKNSMGIEVPNFKRQVIYLKEIFDSAVYQNNNSLLTLALGKDIAGDVIVTDLAKMPHLLVAGTTGSGKSVAVNAMILSILFNATPDEVKFIMIDPKMVELSFYQDIPHLLAPVVTDMSQAANALKWTVGEMEQRYKIMAKIGTKNIVGFNQKVETAIKEGMPLFNPYSIDLTDPEPLQKWPYIVVIIDELADLMMVAGKKIEQYIARIAQKARAVGIHLIVATQRPSVDVITGLIKANIPARISFQVSSKIDSRTILDQMGAESLLGQGDMLFLNPGSGFPRRIHGAFVNDDELHHVVNYLKEQGAPNYNDEILTGASDIAIPGFEDDSNSDNNSVEKDSVFDEAVKFILDSRRCSISSLQTQFGIGYNKAARIMNHLEKIGMVKRTDRGGFELLNHTPN